MTWTIAENEKKTRNWVEMPQELVGTPLFEHATDYIAELWDGSRVMVSKKTGKVFENTSHRDLSDDVQNNFLRKMARLRALYKKKAKMASRHGFVG